MQELAEVFRVDVSKDHEDLILSTLLSPPSLLAYQKRNTPAVGRVSGIGPNAW